MSHSSFSVPLTLVCTDLHQTPVSVRKRSRGSQANCGHKCWPVTLFDLQPRIPPPLCGPIRSHKNPPNRRANGLPRNRLLSSGLGSSTTWHHGPMNQRTMIGRVFQHLRLRPSPTCPRLSAPASWRWSRPLGLQCLDSLSGHDAYS